MLRLLGYLVASTLSARFSPTRVVRSSSPIFLWHLMQLNTIKNENLKVFEIVRQTKLRRGWFSFAVFTNQSRSFQRSCIFLFAIEEFRFKKNFQNGQILLLIFSIHGNASNVSRLFTFPIKALLMDLLKCDSPRLDSGLKAHGFPE